MCLISVKHDRFGADSSPVPSTLCERMRREGENRPGSFQPICTEAGAFEPMQYHTEGYFTCVDINGVELSRHNEQPECKLIVLGLHSINL